MTHPTTGGGSDVRRVSDPPFDDHVLLRNSGATATALTVVRRRGDYVATDTVHAAPRTTYSVKLPAGAGPTFVEVHCEAAMATASVSSGERPPLFSYRDGAVLVSRD